MCDLISRKALLTIPNVCKVVEYGEGGWSVSYNAVPVEAIEAAPAVDAEPVRHGRWIDKTEERHGIYDYRYDCSKCAHIFWAGGVENFNYCPNCGAKMDLEA